MDSLHEASTFEETTDENYQFIDIQTENRDSISSVSQDIPESSIAAATSKEMNRTPLKGSVLLTSVRPGYVWVSDLCRQNWCEMQMCYNLTLPVKIEENPAMQIGSTIHLAYGKLELVLIYSNVCICMKVIQ